MKSCHKEHDNNCWECTADSLRQENSRLRQALLLIADTSDDEYAIRIVKTAVWRE